MDAFKKQLFVSLGIAVGLVAVAIITAQLASGMLTRTAGEIDQRKNELALRTTVTASLAELRQNFTRAEPLQRILDKIFPPKDELINFGRDFINLSRQRNLEFGFNFGNETLASEDKPGFISFSASGKGTQDNFLNFLQDLEKSTLFIKINSVDLVRQTSSESFNIVMDGQVFFR